MSNDIKLNLKEFKHVSSDDKSTVLQHKQGHQLTLAHSALSKNAQEQLKALAQSSKADTNKSQEKAQAPNSKHEKRQRMAEGGMPSVLPEKQEPQMSVDPDYEPPSAPPQQEQDPSLQAKKDLYNQKLAGSGAAANASDMFGPNGEPPKNPVNPQLWGQVENSNEQEQLVGQELEKRKEATKGGDTKRQQLQEHEKAQAQNVVNAKLGLPLVPDPGAPKAPEAIQPGTGQMPSTSMMPQGMADQTSPGTEQEVAAQQQPQDPYSQGLGMRQAGMIEGAQAQANLGNALAEQRQLQAVVQQKAQATYKDTYEKLEKERQDLMNDVRNGYVDPEKYWTGDKNGNGSHSKIASAIGMIIAGFNPTGNPNAAIEFIKHQMDANLQAQAKNLDSKNNLLSANLRQFGNLNDATTMTRIMQNDMMVNQLELAAAKAASPIAKAQLLNSLGQLKMEAAQQFQAFSGQQTISRMVNAARQNPEQAPAILAALDGMDPKRAHELRQTHVPGLGFADTAEGAKGVREMGQIAKSAAGDIAILKQIMSKTGKSLSPVLMAQADTIRRGLIGKLRVPITGPGAMSEGEREILEGMIPDVTKSFSLDASNKKRLETLEQRLNNSYMNMAEMNGLKIPDSMKATVQRPEIANGAVVMGKDGRQYKRVGNSMVPVKK